MRYTNSIPLLIFGLFLSGCVTDRQVISNAEDTNKGLAPAVMTDSQLATYIQQVGSRIVATAQTMDKQNFDPGNHKSSEDASWMFTGMEFHFVNSKTLNAFTTGGKHMYIYTELFQSCKNEDELAAVMAHEYSHVYCRHVAKGMEQQYVLSGASMGASAAGYLAGGEENGAEYASVASGAASSAGKFIGMGFTRGDESQADQTGFQFYCRAGWDPNRFGGFFQTMIDKGYDTTPEMMSDHPKLSNRVIAVQGWIKALPADAKNWRKPPVADETKFKQLQARAAQLAKTSPDDKSLKTAQLMLAAFPSCVSPTDAPEQKRARAAIVQASQPKQKPPAK